MIDVRKQQLHAFWREPASGTTPSLDRDHVHDTNAQQQQVYYYSFDSRLPAVRHVQKFLLVCARARACVYWNIYAPMHVTTHATN